MVLYFALLDESNKLKYFTFFSNENVFLIDGLHVWEDDDWRNSGSKKLDVVYSGSDKAARIPCTLVFFFGLFLNLTLFSGIRSL